MVAPTPPIAKAHLTKAAQGHLQGLSDRGKRLAERVERNELTLVGLLHAAILGLRDPGRGREDVGLCVANDVLLYARRRGGVQRKWLIDLFERHGDLAFMRTNGGRLQRLTARGEELTHPLDEVKLSAELQQKLGTPDDAGRRISSPTLFDRSTKQQTMQATKYAK